MAIVYIKALQTELAETKEKLQTAESKIAQNAPEPVAEPNPSNGENSVNGKETSSGDTAS